LKALWLLLPAGFSNMSPILAARVFPKWNTPIDLGKYWRGKMIFGSHKTYRGLLSGTVVGTLVFAIQQWLFKSNGMVRDLSSFDYLSVSVFFGTWMGFGALMGDLIKSFFKRRFEIAPGKSWTPFDQIDWVIGSLLCTSIVFLPNLQLIAASLVVGISLHFLMKVVGYWLGLNPAPM
jgi:CDP-2,3-bis-(O-geranylgeranyl)-sn-glycerol synthase